jgi:hypothetical protein
MKRWLPLLVVIAVLQTQGLGQEPKHVLKQEPVVQGSVSTSASGRPQAPAPVVEPKALPPLNPPLGDIARQARAAHAAALKAHGVVETDEAAQK